MTTAEFFILHKGLFGTVEGNGMLLRSGPGPLSPWTSCHTLGTDMSVWNAISDTPPDKLVPSSPFERSRLRSDGYAMWDLVIGGGASAMRRNLEGRKIKPKGWAPCRGTNHCRTRMWPLYANRNMTGCTNVLQIGSRAEWCNRLERAHMLAHAELDRRWYPSTLESSLQVGSAEFVQAFAELAVAELFHIGITSDRPKRYPTRLPYGIYVSATTRNNFASPAPAMFPFDRKLELADRLFAVVHVVVEVGSDPIAMVMPGAEPSPWEDQWAGLPVRAMVMGWETVDWFGAQDVGLRPPIGLGCPTGELVFYSHVDDLMPPDTFGFYLDAAEHEPSLVADSKVYVRPEQLTAADPGRQIMLRTPGLPCHICLLRNRDVVEQTERPDFTVPPGWKEDVAWAGYFAKMKSVIRCAARSAAVYDPGRSRTRAVRLRNRAEYMKQLKRKEIARYGSLPKKRHT